MTIYAQRGVEIDNGVDVWEFTPEEWDAWIDRATAQLGISYEELERQDREDDFESFAAEGLWVIIGGSRPSTHRD